MSSSSQPRLTRADFKTYYTDPCILAPDGRDWYKGTGIPPAEHPLATDINFQPCDACHSEDVLVIAAQSNFSYHTGDDYWDYEIECQACHQFSQRSYASN